MNTKDTGGPAFPVHLAEYRVEYGMELRDYFAAKAMSGMCFGAPIPSKLELKTIASRSYEMADAMLAERNKQ